MPRPRQRSSTPRPMRTELVPYAGIARVSIAAVDAEARHAGFDVTREPLLVPPASGGDPAALLMQLAASSTVPRRQS